MFAQSDVVNYSRLGVNLARSERSELGVKLWVN